MKDERFLEKLGGKCNMSAADTYTEVAINTPVSGTEELAMLIHKIAMVGEWPNPTAGSVSHIREQVMKRAIGSSVGYDDPDLIWRVQKAVETSGVGDPAWQSGSEDNETYFDPPILYARPQIFVSIDGANNGAVKGMVVAIWYTLEKVSKDAFIAALVG